MIIGHYFIWNTADCAASGDLAPKLHRVANESEAAAEARDFAGLPDESWCAYLAVHDNGLVVLHQYSMEEIGMGLSY